MTTTREKLIDWLADLPDNTEIGIEDIYLRAMIGKRAQEFLVGELSDESIQIELTTFMGRREDMKARLHEIHDEGLGMDTAEGAIVVSYDGYLRGVPDLFTNDVNEAFMFEDRAQAEKIITAFADALLNPQVLDLPSRALYAP